MSLAVPQTATVTFNGKSVELKKLALGKWAILAGKLKAIGSLVNTQDFASEDTNRSFASIMDLLEKAPDALAEIASLVAPVSSEEVKEASVEDVLALLLAAWELNNLMRLLGDTRKKAMGKMEGAPE